MKEKRNLIIAGLSVGIIAVLLTVFGNPANMGFCIACFMRDIAGAVGLHRAEAVQYLRPEIIGLVWGAFAMALFNKEFKPRGGSAPILRFILGICVSIGTLVFLGCPLRMVLRLAGGDLNALVGLIGFVCGILGGIFFLNKGFTLKRTYTMAYPEGFAFLGINTVFLVAFLAFPALFLFSKSGPGSMHAPVLISLLAGILAGIAAQRTRLCTMGGIRDLFLFKDTTLITGFVGIFIAVLIGNIILGKFHLGFVIGEGVGQPIAHTDGVWNFIGMLVVGLGSVLLGGCPLRQLILAGEGNSDSAAAVLGVLAGAALSHNFSMASSAAGTGPNGKIGALIALAIILFIAVVNTFFTKTAASAACQASEGGVK